ncbi:MAG TPA: cohesin domain-containing protein, partial [Pyrinomonadaceae bacterium]|nr:cohesin domain-containing protein [Pyrinomonadaceae bacterium]
AALKFDSDVLAVRSVSQGTVFLGMQSAPAFTHSTNGGALLVSVMPGAHTEQALTGAGVLVTIEIEALQPGACTIDFTTGDVQLIPSDGRKVVSKLMPAQVSVE